MSDPDQSPLGELSAAAGASPEGILARIADSDKPAPLVRALGPHDLLGCWTEADDEQRIDLLRLADPLQVRMLIDLTCWRDYTPDLESLEELVSPLALSGVNDSVRALGCLGQELRTMLLRRKVRVHLLDNRNDEVPAEEGSELSPMPDGYYVLEFPDPEALSDTERALWKALALLPFEEYQLELECIRHDLPAELEEAALRWRTGRLADHGFASTEEARSLLAPRSPREARELADGAEATPSREASLQVPGLLLENLAGDDFLDRALELFAAGSATDSPRRLESLAVELTEMTSRFLTATRVDLGDVNAVSRGARLGRDLVALGLASTASGQLDEGARLLGLLPPAIHLQVGLGAVQVLRTRARDVGADERLHAGGRRLATLDTPHRIAVECLDREVPLRWPALEEREAGTSAEILIPRETELVGFSRTTQIAWWERLAAEAALVPTLLFDALACPLPAPAETPASSLALTALCNASRGRDSSCAPVPPGDALGFASEISEASPDDYVRGAEAVLGPLLDAAAEGTADPVEEDVLRRNLIERLVLIGRARLAKETPEQVLLVEPL